MSGENVVGKDLHLTAQSASRRFRDRARAAELLYLEGHREEAARLMSDAAEIWLATQGGESDEREARVRTLVMRAKHATEQERDTSTAELIRAAIARDRRGARWIAWSLVLLGALFALRLFTGREHLQASIRDEEVAELVDGDAGSDWVATGSDPVIVTIELSPPRVVRELQIVRSVRELSEAPIRVELLGTRSADVELPAGDPVFVALPVGGEARSRVRLRLTPESGVVSIGEIRLATDR